MALHYIGNSVIKQAFVYVKRGHCSVLTTIHHKFNLYNWSDCTYFASGINYLISR